MSEKSPKTSVIDEMLGLGDVKPGERLDDGPPSEPQEPHTLPGEPPVRPTRKTRPPKEPPEGDVEPETEYEPLPEGDEEPPDPESAEADESEEGDQGPESEEEGEDGVSFEKREADLFRKLLIGENPYGEGAAPATPPTSTPPPAVTPPKATATADKSADPSTSEDSRVQLEDPFEGLDEDDDLYVRLKRLQKLTEYEATKKIMTKVGTVVDEVYEQKEAAMAILRDTYDQHKWLRDPARAEAFQRSLHLMQQANPGITDPRKLVDKTVTEMARFLRVDEVTGEPLGTKSKSEIKEESGGGAPPPKEAPNRTARGKGKPKLKGEAAVIADTMTGFRKGGFF